MKNLVDIIVNDLKENGKCGFGDSIFFRENDKYVLEFKKKKLPPRELLEGLPEKYSPLMEEPNIDYHSLAPSNVKITNITSSHVFATCDEKDLKIAIESFVSFLLQIQKIYSDNELHITRMFGSYSLLGIKNAKLSSLYSTPSPIKYCPLMNNLLRQIAGDVADKLLLSLKSDNVKEYQSLMSQLIEDVVIKSGGFDDNRPLTTCERHVTFGASEIMSDAMLAGLVQANIIVSNNLGTVRTTTAETTQGVVKRMSGLFYTSPSENSLKNALNEGIIPLHPFTADIDQLAGVKKCLEMGYKKLAVSVAAKDNKYLDQISELEVEGTTIYKLALCATGVDEETADKMGKYADIVWSCASKPVRERIAPKALLQVGIKIPVYIMSLRAFELIKPRLRAIDKTFDFNSIRPTQGLNMPILYNEGDKLKTTYYKDLQHKCIDCPDPCI